MRVEIDSATQVANVAAALDARGLNPKLVDALNQFSETFKFGWVLTETEQLADNLGVHVQSACEDYADAIDALRARSHAQQSDSSHVADTLLATSSDAIFDAAGLQDSLATNGTTALSDSASLHSSLFSNTKHAGPAESFVVSDSGYLIQNDYMESDYIALGYVGQVLTF